jgi:hypothetical protein
MATKNQPIDITPKSVEKVLNEPQESVGKKLNVHSSIHSSENVQLKKQIAVLDCGSDDDYYDAEAEE